MRVWKCCVLFYIGGMLYVAVEFLFRGWSHSSMFVVGGLCFLLIGSLNRGLVDLKRLPLLAVLGAGIITGMELTSGVILNIWMGLGVWDYSHLPLNLSGQICPYFFLLWIPLSGLAMVINDYLRFFLFRESYPVYRWY